MDERLKSRTLDVLARNLAALSPLGTPAKGLGIGKNTYDMRGDPANQGQNDARDAARHSEWSRRMAQVDPQDLQLGPWEPRSAPR